MTKTLWPDLSKRARVAELMDLPDADSKRLINTVEQFRIINALFTSSKALLINHFLKKMRMNPRQDYHLLDLGAGGCDLDIWFIKQCRRYNLSVTITCLDSNPLIAGYAQNKCRPYPELTVVCDSIFNLGQYLPADYIFSNHLLHHLTDEEIKKLLGLVCHARQGFLFNDIHRSRWAFWGFSLFSRIFFRHSFATIDGERSVRNALVPKELIHMLPRGNDNMDIVVGQTFPARLILMGKRRPIHRF